MTIASMVGAMMWFKREPKLGTEPKGDGGVVSRLRKKKTILKPTRESSERETSTESEVDRRRYSDILDMKVSLGMMRFLLKRMLFLRMPE